MGADGQPVIPSFKLGKAVQIPGIGSFPSNWPWEDNLPALAADASMIVEITTDPPPAPPAVVVVAMRAIALIEDATNKRAEALTAVAPAKRDRYMIKRVAAAGALKGDQAAMELLMPEAGIRNMTAGELASIINSKANTGDANALALEYEEAKATAAIQAAAKLENPDTARAAIEKSKQAALDAIANVGAA